MVVECLAILIVLLLMIFMFLRAKKREYAFLTTSLLLVPFVHLIMMLFGNTLARLLSVDFIAFVIVLDVVAVVISCLLIGFGSTRLPTSKQRKGFLILASGYSILLTCMLVFHVLKG